MKLGSTGKVCVGGLNVDNPHRDGATVCRDGKMNKGMVEWTNMPIINRPIKNSKIGVETMSTLGKCKINFNNP